MAIRPIDLQVIVPKAQSNPNAREHVVNKEAMQLQQTQMENKRESTIKDHQVNQLAQKDSGKVEEKKEKDLTQDKKKKKLAKKEENEESDANQTNVKKPVPKDWNFHRFDMKV